MEKIKAVDGPKSYNTKINLMFSSVLECLNRIQKITVVYRAVDTSGVVIQAARNTSRKSKPDQLKTSLVCKMLSCYIMLVLSHLRLLHPYAC